MQYHLLGYHSVTTRVRFGQTDRYGHTWHGHLPTFFEEGRAGFARHFRLGTDVLLGHGISIPMLELTVEYCRASYEDELLDIQLTLLRPALKLPGFLFIYRIFGAGGEIARGRTRQLLVGRAGVPIVRTPPEVAELQANIWRELERAPRWSDPQVITKSRILMGDQVTALDSPVVTTPDSSIDPKEHHEDRA